jgi:hypothetical protein
LCIGAGTAIIEPEMLVRIERVGLVAAMALATLNVFTGAPLIGVWTGAHIVGSNGQITMLAVLAVVVTMFIAAYGMIVLLAWLGAQDDRLSGRSATVRRHTPWLRSMSGERPANVPGAKAQLNTLEYVLVAGVVLAVLAFEYWFFFKAGSPLDGRSGRS